MCDGEHQHDGHSTSNPPSPTKSVRSHVNVAPEGHDALVPHEDGHSAQLLRAFQKKV